jgi:hypothetical protein
MRKVIIILILLFVISIIHAKVEVNKNNIEFYYSKFSDFIGVVSFPQDSLYKYYRILNSNKSLLTDYLIELSNYELKWHQKITLITTAGVFKIEKLKQDIKNIDSISYFTYKCFYLYQINGNMKYCNILKSIANLPIDENNVDFMTEKVHAINLLGWVLEPEILDFLLTIDTKGLDGLGDIYHDSIFRLQALLELKN